MASRRTRIKGIANIPQRKKINQENVSNLDTAKSDFVLLNNKSNIVVLKEENIEELAEHNTIDSSANTLESVKEFTCITQSNSTEESVINDTNISNVLECIKPKLAQSFNDTSDVAVTDVANNVKNDAPCASSALGTVKDTPTQVSQIKHLEMPNHMTNMSRRKFLKPGINLNAVKKRQNNKEAIETIPTSETIALSDDVIRHENSERIEGKETYLKPSEKVVVISEIRIPNYDYKPTPVACDITKIISSESSNFSVTESVYSEVTLNETHLGINEVPVRNSSVVTFSSNIKKVVPETHMSDSEYPAPPPSPSKINRSRIKAIPRLSQRKTSCSASESEDDTRKYGRIRNNSVCSVISTTCLEPPTPSLETVQSKEVAPILKKINRTEQSRKLAEARREFQKRFGLNIPDKQRLKMIDLIFYNPSSNPMSQTNSKPTPENYTTKIEKDSEEIIDDPTKVDIIEEKGKENNGESGMPVPQIKIGPSGEIILDEQSLIVENAEVARQKEQILKSRIVDGDFDTGYGIYKRAPRSRSWNQKETLRFYKAINLIGTDFTVMTQLFPKRTRRELKIKFKKEEKINRHLIDKAIMESCQYNFTDLKREIDVEEQEEAALQKLKEEELKKFEDDKQQKREKKRKLKEEKTNNIILAEPADTTDDPSKDIIMLPPKKRLTVLEKPVKIKPKSRKIKLKPLNIKTVLDDDSDADISDMETQSESEEEETIPFLKPTRSGRMPKSTVRYTTIVDQVLRQPFNDKIKTNISDETPSQQSSDPTKTFSTPDDTPAKLSNLAIRNRRSSSISSIESNSEKLVPGAIVIMTEEDANGKTEYKVFMVTPEKKMAPLDLDSDIVARLVKEKQTEEYNSEFMVAPVPEKNITIPAADRNETSKSQEPEETLLINYLDEITDTTDGV